MQLSVTVKVFEVRRTLVFAERNTTTFPHKGVEHITLFPKGQNALLIYGQRNAHQCRQRQAWPGRKFVGLEPINRTLDRSQSNFSPPQALKKREKGTGGEILPQFVRNDTWCD